MGDRAHRNMLAGRHARQQQSTLPTTASKAPKSNITNGKHVAPSTEVPDASSKSTITMGPTAPPEPLDILAVPVYKRKDLAEGPTIKFIQGEAFVISLPRKLFVSASSKGASTVNAQNEVHLPTNLHNASLHFLLTWLYNATKKNDVRPPRVYRDLESAIQLCNAADALGLMKYVQNTINYQQKTIFKWVPDEVVVSIVESCAADAGTSTAVQEKFVSMVAERIGYLVRKNMFPVQFEDTRVSQEDYFAMVAKYKNVHTAVQRVNAPWMKRQQAKLAAETRRFNRERKAAEAEARPIRQKDAARLQYEDDMNGRAALLKKLAGQTKVVTLTKEELEMATRLKDYGDWEIGKFL